jgi:hypothetical protein
LKHTVRNSERRLPNSLIPAAAKYAESLAVTLGSI